MHPIIERHLMKTRVILNFKRNRFQANPSTFHFWISKAQALDIQKWKHRCHKYLSHITGNNLNDNKDFERQLRNCMENTICLRTFGSCSHDLKLQLFMSYSSFMYAAFLWCDCATSQYRPLVVAYNNSFRWYPGLILLLGPANERRRCAQPMRDVVTK